MKARLEQVEVGREVSFTCRRTAGPGWGFQWHFHPEYELTLIVRGSGQRFVGDDIADFRAGDLVLLGPSLPHTWYSRRPVRNPPHEAVVIQFLPSFMGDGFLERPETRSIARLLRQAGSGLHFRGASQAAAAERMQQITALPPLMRLTELLHILDILARCRSARTLSSPRFKAPARPSEQRRIHRALQYVHENLAGELTLTDAAARVRLSPSAFSRFFRRASGKGFAQYVNELRVGRACELLAETDRNIAVIAMDCGFNNLSNFNRRFKEVRGLAPREYRSHFSAPAGV
jgi:AraC-like DNA-binding protein